VIEWLLDANFIVSTFKIIGERVIMQLKNVLLSKIPVVSITTNDIINIAKVLTHIISSPKKTRQFINLKTAKNSKTLINLLSNNNFGYIVNYDESVDLDFEKLYNELDKQGKVLVLINTEYDHDCIYKAGFATTPTELIANKLKELLEDEEVAHQFVPILKDLSLKQIEDILKICSNKFGEISQETLLKTKRGYSKLSAGLHVVDTNLTFYHPIPVIEDWLESQGNVFSMKIPRELKPKGLLFHGVAGVGKTYSAKRVAQKLGIPLYRLAIGSLMNKYHGESERNLERALVTLESASPCAVLLDEVEKIFNKNDDSGVNSRILSQLLWWLQEDQSEIITIMTTNDKEAIPPELYRAGRIDRDIEFQYLDVKEACIFAESVIAQYLDYIEEAAEISVTVHLAITKAGKSTTAKLTYASITELVYSEIRRGLNHVDK